MSRGLSEASMARALADHVCERVTRKLIAALQKMNDGLMSGEEPGVKDSWDGIRVCGARRG